MKYVKLQMTKEDKKRVLYKSPRTYWFNGTFSLKPRILNPNFVIVKFKYSRRFLESIKGCESCVGFCEKFMSKEFKDGTRIWK